MKRNSKGQFIKGEGFWNGKKRGEMKWLKEHQIKKGQHLNKETEIKEGQRLSTKTEFKKTGYKRINGSGKKALKVYFEKTGMHRLPEGCVIHHINQDPSDNSFNNLQLMDKSFHRKLHYQFNKLNEELVC